MKKIFLLIILSSLTFSNLSAQKTLNLDFAERCFSKTKSKMIDSLIILGFKNLSDEEIFDEELMESKNNIPPNTNERIYLRKGLRKVYEFRKTVGGGVCKLTVLMAEPNCTTISKIFWNSNLRFSAGSYSQQIKELGYERTDDQTIEKYTNKNGFKLMIKIRKYSNEILFNLSKTDKLPLK